MKGRVYTPNGISQAKEKVLQLYGAEICKSGFDCVDAENAARKFTKVNFICRNTVLSTISSLV